MFLNSFGNDFLCFFIQTYLLQKNKIALSQTCKTLYNLVWYPKKYTVWTSITFYNVTNFNQIITKYSLIFKHIQKICFGKACTGLRIDALYMIALYCPHVIELKIGDVSNDSQFLFGHKIFPTFALSPRTKNRSNIAEFDENKFTQIEKLFVKIKRLQVHSKNYSLGLYSLIERFKKDANHMIIEVITDTIIIFVTPSNQITALLPV